MDLTSRPRIACFDAVRALAAVMGILLHTAAGYMKYPVPQWPRFGEQSNMLFDCIACGIHLFRLPVFFFLAGFFSYQLLMKYSCWGFIKNRFKRIAIPFLVFSLLINLFSILKKISINQMYTFHDVICTFNVSYLWFLEYLLIYYLFFILARFLFQYQFFKIKSIEHYVNNILLSKWSWLLPTLLNFLFLYFGNFWFNPIILSFVPNVWLLCVYFIYFSFGILIAKQNNVAEFFILSWKKIWLNLLIFTAYFFIILLLPHREYVRVIAIIVYALLCFLFFSSFIAICVTFFTKTNSWLRFIAHASYWIYLSQIFFIVIIHHYITPLTNSIFAQFCLICLLTLLLTLLFYRFFEAILSSRDSIASIIP